MKYIVRITNMECVEAYAETDDIDDVVKNLANNFNWAELESNSEPSLEISIEEYPDQRDERFNSNVENYILNSF